tara:strand:+ start:437 stop:589 length:153 start_codon:yes stop_codon:yes gene_type:complete
LAKPANGYQALVGAIIGQIHLELGSGLLGLPPVKQEVFDPAVRVIECGLL